MAVPASTDDDPAASATVGVVDLRYGGRAVAGTHVYAGDALVTPPHSHDHHQLEYAAHGVVGVETAAGHYLLPPQHAAWMPAGLEHRTTIRTSVQTIAVLFEPSLVPDAGDRARILAVPPLLREMVLHATRWPIDRRTHDVAADRFFLALAGVVAESLDAEQPLWLPTSTDPIVAAAMAHTREHLATVTAAEVAAAVHVSERTLRRRFHDEVGESWRSYAQRARILAAMAKLAEPGERTVLAVATAVGFDSVNAFTRAFVNRCGETPSAYRRRALTAARPG